jgi:hypothetical protein
MRPGNHHLHWIVVVAEYAHAHTHTQTRTMPPPQIWPFLEDVVPASSHTYYLIAGRSSRPLSPDAVATKINQSFTAHHTLIIV